MRVQNAGDKSGEVSVFDNDDDILLEMASNDDEDDDDDGNEDEISYGDDGVSYGDDGNNSDDGLSRDTHSIHHNSLNGNNHHHDPLAPSPERRQALNDTDSRKSQDYVQDTEVLVQDLLVKFESSNQISYEELQDSLLDLNMKWETILEQTVYDTDQQITTAMQERNDIELEMNHLRRVHEDEIDSVKAEVMEQSQKIIRHELKVNAERERQFEEETEIAVSQAIEKCKEEMQEEFDILLTGMKDSEKELKQRYNRLLKETEVRIRDEVFSEAHQKSKNETEIVITQFEEMKKQLVEVTMELTTLQAESESKVEDLTISIQQKTSNIHNLQDDIKKAAKAHESQISQMKTKIDEQASIISSKDEERSNAVRDAVSKKDSEIGQMKEEFGKRVKDIKIESDRAMQDLKKSHDEALADTRSEIARYISLLAEKDAEKTLLEQVIEADFEESVKSMKTAHEAEVVQLKQQLTEQNNSLEEANAVGEQMQSLLDEEKMKLKELREEYDKKIEMIVQKQAEEMDDLRRTLEREKNESFDELNTKLSEEMAGKHSLQRQHEDAIYQLKVDHDTEIQRLQTEKTAALTKIEMLSTREKDNKDQIEQQRKQIIEELTLEHQSELKDITEVFAQEKVELLAEAQAEIYRLQHENEVLRAEAIAQKEQLRRDLMQDRESKVKEAQQSVWFLEEKLKGLETMLSEEQSSKLLLQRQHDEIIAGLKNDLDTQLVRLKNSFAQEKAEVLAEAKAEIDHLRVQNEALTGALHNSKAADYQHPPSEIQLSGDAHADADLRNSSTLQSVSESVKEGIDFNTMIEICSLDGHSHGRSVGSDHLLSVNGSSSHAKNLSPLTMNSPQLHKFNAARPKPISRSTSNTSVTKPKVRTGILRANSFASSNSQVYPMHPILKFSKRKSKTGAYTSPRSKDSTLAPFAPPQNMDVRLLILIPITDRMKKMAYYLQIEIVDTVVEATHVIAGSSQHSLRRTSKLMAALCLTPNILKAEWLEESYSSRGLLSCNHYLLLNDSKAESVYSFSMRNTLREGNDRRKAGGLLCDWSVYVCDEVAGNKAPKSHELKMMIRAAGGKWITYDDIPVPVTDDPTHVIVLTSDPPLQKQLDESKAQIAAENGAGFFTTSWLFDCMMHQKLFGIKRGLGRL